MSQNKVRKLIRVVIREITDSKKLSSIYVSKLKQLEVDNKFTLPKIPTSNVFLNKNVEMSELSSIRKNADVYIEKNIFEELPEENIDIKLIIPTQKSLNINNLKSAAKHIKDSTGAYLFKHNGYYYILDGHHRVANKIINGENKVLGYVYNQN